MVFQHRVFSNLIPVLTNSIDGDKKIPANTTTTTITVPSQSVERTFDVLCAFEYCWTHLIIVWGVDVEVLVINHITASTDTLSDTVLVPI